MSSQESIEVITHSGVKTDSANSPFISEESEIQKFLIDGVTEEDIKPFICMNCGDAFDAQISFNIHNLSCNGRELLPCMLCDDKFWSSHSLREHLKLHRDLSPLSIACSQYGKNFANSSSVMIHESICKGEQQQQHTSITQDSTVDLSLQLDTYSELNNFQQVLCTHCNKVFVNNHKLKAHEHRMHAVGRSYTCRQCDTIFLRPLHLKRHVLQMHPDVHLFICVYCSKSFNKSQNLKIHEVSCSNERRHKCSKCDKKFNTAGQLKVHGNIHTGERPYRCGICDQRFMTYSSLKAHKFEHTDERPFVCTECQKGFTMACYLRRHMLVHSGEMPHSCPNCYKTFTQKSSLKRHLLIHKGERPHVCSECGKTFTQASSLKIHKAVHIRSP